jgi:DNA-binding response OmpR family regulator
MGTEQERRIEPVRIDLANACLWRGDRAVALTPKAFSVLRYLSDCPGRLVTKQELLEAL